MFQVNYVASVVKSLFPGYCRSCLDINAAIDYIRFNKTHFGRTLFCHSFHLLNQKKYEGYFEFCNQPLCGSEKFFYNYNTRYRLRTSEIFSNMCIWLIWTKKTQTEIKLIKDEFLPQINPTGGFNLTPLKIRNATLNMYSVDGSFPIIKSPNMTNNSVVYGERVMMVIAKSNGTNPYVEFYLKGFENTKAQYLRYFNAFIILLITCLIIEVF